MEQWIGSVHSKMAWRIFFKFGVYRVLEKSSSCDETSGHGECQWRVDVWAHLYQMDSLRRWMSGALRWAEDWRMWNAQHTAFFTFPKVCCPEGKLTSREQENSRGSISAPQITPLRMLRGIDVCAEVEDRRRCGLIKIKSTASCCHFYLERRRRKTRKLTRRREMEFSLASGNCH